MGTGYSPALPPVGDGPDTWGAGGKQPTASDSAPRVRLETPGRKRQHLTLWPRSFQHRRWACLPPALPPLSGREEGSALTLRVGDSAQRPRLSPPSPPGGGTLAKQREALMGSPTTQCR